MRSRLIGPTGPTMVRSYNDWHNIFRKNPSSYCSGSRGHRNTVVGDSAVKIGHVYLQEVNISTCAALASILVLVSIQRNLYE